MDQQQDLSLFMQQLETVAAHCDDTNMRPGAATVREAIERLSATPTPDVVRIPDDVSEIIDGIQDHMDEYQRDGRFIGCTAGCIVCRNSEQIIAALESLSRERATLAAGFKAAVRELNDVVDPFVLGALGDHEPDIHTGGRWAETPQRIIAMRKALALISEGEGEG